MKFNPLSPRWQHDDANVRLEAVQSEKLNEDVLQNIASNDADATVKSAAIARVTDTSFLAQLGKQEVAARQRWAELIGSDLQNLAVTNGLEQPFLMALALHAPKEEFRLDAVEQLPEPSLCELLRQENLSRIHQHCAAAIESEAEISELQKLFIDKDKNVSRILKSKLQAIKHDRDAAEAVQSELEALLTKAQTLRDSEPAADYGRRIDIIHQAWQNLEDKNSPEAKETSAIINQCKEILAAQPDPEEILNNQIEQFIEKCAALRSACEADPTLPSLPEQLKTLKNDWPAAADDGRRTEIVGDLEALAEANADWQNLLSNGAKLGPEGFAQTRAELSWPEAFAQPSHFEEKADALLAELKENAEAKAAEEKYRAEFDEQLARLEQQLNEGHIKAANRASARINKLIGEGKPSPEQSSRAQLLQNQLQDLKDWQGFATQPKRDDLCNSMQSLVDDTALTMPEKAKAIKELQEEWKKLGSSDSRPAQKSWARFKTLGDEAYAPVAEYFAQQHAEREQHLQARAAICEALEKFEQDTDWDSDINWKEVASFLQSQNAKWRQHGNVPRREKKAIEKRFETASSPIWNRMQAIQQKHIEEKNALINELKDKLAADEVDMANLINRAKSAQQAWQKIGYIERRKDQKLWKAFRAQCDAVFARRDEVKQEQKSADNELANTYREACRSFASKIESAFEKKDIAEFRKAMAKFDLPKTHRGLERESKKLINQAEKELKDRARQSEELMFREFQRQCDALDKGASIDESDISLSSDLQKALANRSDRTLEEQDLILIRLEILADISSPESSQAARMAYQVERLNKELSRGEKETRSEREQVRDLLTQWFTTTNKDTALAPRFQKIASKLGIPV